MAPQQKHHHTQVTIHIHSFLNKVHFVNRHLTDIYSVIYICIRVRNEQIIGKQLKNDQLRDNICPGS